MPSSVKRVLFRIENIWEDIQGRIILTRFRNHFREGRNHPTYSSLYLKGMDTERCDI